MPRPSGGYATAHDGEEDILDNREDHNHRTAAELLACITLADGTVSRRLDELHGYSDHITTAPASYAIGLG